MTPPLPTASTTESLRAIMRSFEFSVRATPGRPAHARAARARPTGALRTKTLRRN